MRLSEKLHVILHKKSHREKNKLKTLTTDSRLQN